MLVFYLLVVGALSRLSAVTKRRLAILQHLVCIVCCLACVLGNTDPQAVLFGFAFRFMSVLKGHRTLNRRSVRFKIHRKLRPWQTKWNKMHLPLRSCRVVRSVDDDCAFVPFAQGLQQVTLPKVAFSRLCRNARYKAVWDGNCPRLSGHVVGVNILLKFKDLVLGDPKLKFVLCPKV